MSDRLIPHIPGFFEAKMGTNCYYMCPLGYHVYHIHISYITIYTHDTIGCDENQLRIISTISDVFKYVLY